MSPRFQYQVVQLANGSRSIRSLAEAETFHPVIGPVAEAESLYLKQLRLPDRLADGVGEFVIWDIGLGAAANVLTVLKHTSHIPRPLRVVSFDHTLEALRFGLQHAAELEYFVGYEAAVGELLASGSSSFLNGVQPVEWSLIEGDFPTRLFEPAAEQWPKPHAIFFDAYSPARNPDMWTQPLFARLFSLLDASRPCALPTYSRSTLLRVSLLLAGFHVGAGHATGEKEETTVASNSPSLLEEPLGRDWLLRAGRSTSAEPLWTAEYRQEPLSQASRERLAAHPQFSGF